MKQFARLAAGAANMLLTESDAHLVQNGTLGTMSNGTFTADPNYPGTWAETTALAAQPATGSTFANGVFTPPPAPAPSAAQAAQATYVAATLAGLAITSAGTPAVNGTYGIQTSDLTAMMAMQLAVEAAKPLPAAYWDSKGNHGTLTAAQVTSIAYAIFTYEAALVAWLNGGGTGAPPAANVAIA